MFPTDVPQLLLLFSSCREKKTTSNSRTNRLRIKNRRRSRVRKQSNSFWESFMLTRHTWRSCSRMKVFLLLSRFYFSFILLKNILYFSSSFISLWLFLSCTRAHIAHGALSGGDTGRCQLMGLWLLCGFVINAVKVKMQELEKYLILEKGTQMILL